MNQPAAQIEVKKTSSSFPEDEMYEIVNGKRVVDSDVPMVGDDTLYEIVDGRRVEKVMGYFECGIASILVELIGQFVRSHELGRTRMETLFRIDSTRMLGRRPDVAFVSYKRWARDRKMSRGDAWNVVPDLAAEVVSPTNGAAEVAKKVKEYLAAGVTLVWVIFPELRQIYVHESSGSVRILEHSDELGGGTVLPGFRLPVTALFEDEREEFHGEPGA